MPWQALRYFPRLPARTTVLDLSHNALTSFSSLSPDTQNYQDVSGLDLAYNQLTTIDIKLVRLKLDKYFRADHNQISDLLFDVSQHLQKYLKNEVSLGGNPWSCYCNAEITKLVRRGWIGSQHLDLMLKCRMLKSRSAILTPWSAVRDPIPRSWSAR